MEKEIEVTWNGEKVKLTIASLTYGEYKKIRRKSIVMKHINGQPMEFRDADMYDLLFILASIRKAPFETIQENIEKLSIEDGQLLEKEIAEINFPQLS